MVRRCERCGSTDRVERHHEPPQSVWKREHPGQPWRGRMVDLCWTCHRTNGHDRDPDMHRPGAEALLERNGTEHFRQLGQRKVQLERAALGEREFRRLQAHRGRLGAAARWDRVATGG